MALALQPRIAYHQPQALCRTLVYRWGGLLVGSGMKETEIVNGLVTAQDRRAQTPAFQAVVAAHRDKWQTKAYSGASKLSEASTVSWNGKDIYYLGHAVIDRKDFKMHLQGRDFAQNVDDSNDRAGSVRQAVTGAVAMAGTLRQLALAVSLHYRYPQNSNESSGHTVGVFVSRGGMGVRQAGARFFDPNVGSWRFGSLDLLLNFYQDDWLPNFLANTMRADPGHGNKGPRELEFFRLVRLIAHD